MTKTKSHWFRMVYTEVQDNNNNNNNKKLKVWMKKNGLQSVLFDWYSIGTRSIESRISAKNQQT